MGIQLTANYSASTNLVTISFPDTLPRDYYLVTGYIARYSINGDTNGGGALTFGEDGMSYTDTPGDTGGLYTYVGTIRYGGDEGDPSTWETDTTYVSVFIPRGGDSEYNWWWPYYLYNMSFYNGAYFPNQAYIHLSCSTERLYPNDVFVRRSTTNTSVQPQISVAIYNTEIQYTSDGSITVTENDEVDYTNSTIYRSWGMPGNPSASDTYSGSSFTQVATTSSNGNFTDNIKVGGIYSYFKKNQDTTYSYLFSVIIGVEVYKRLTLENYSNSALLGTLYSECSDLTLTGNMLNKALSSQNGNYTNSISGNYQEIQLYTTNTWDPSTDYPVPTPTALSAGTYTFVIEGLLCLEKTISQRFVIELVDTTVTEELPTSVVLTDTATKTSGTTYEYRALVADGTSQETSNIAAVTTEQEELPTEVTYTDTSTKAGGNTYSYRVQVQDGLATEYSNVENIPVSAQLPAPVVSLSATETSVTPTWSDIPNAQSYKLRYGAVSTITGDGSTTASGSVLTGLTAGTVYYVQTKAIGDNETYSDSEWSTVSSVRTSKTWVVTNATDTPASGLLTIREAIANAFTGDTIHFSPSIANSTIVLGGTELFIDGKGLVIDGESNNITLSGHNASMVLRTAGDTNVCVFRNLKITQGSTSVYHGAGICNYAILTVENCVIYNNQATDSKFGGGVFSGKSLLMKNCLLYGNTATNGGAVGVAGTGIVTIDHCTICNNTATVGGAIYGSGTITLIDSIIHNNIGSTSGISSSGIINASYTLGPSPSIWTGTNSNNYAYDGALPLFVDLANNYFALAYNSQALGKSSAGGYVGSPALLQLAPPSPSFSASGETTFTGSWNDVANATSYAIRYGTVNPPTGNGTSITSGDTVSGLTRGTVYYIQVKTVGNGTAYCDSDWSTVQSITTDGVALIPLSAPTVTTTATSSTIVATVATVEHATAYKVRYSSTNPPTGDGATYVSGTDISGLEPSTNYYLQFKSVGDGSTYSDSDWGEVITQVTTFITFKIVQTTSASVNNLPIVPGTLIIVTDTQTLYVDIAGGTRIILSAYNALNARISTLEGYHAD